MTTLTMEDDPAMAYKWGKDDDVDVKKVSGDASGMHDSNPMSNVSG